MAMCFHPGYGLRAVTGKRTMSFLICFQCNRVDVFNNELPYASFALDVNNLKNPIERILAENEKKLKEGKPKEGN